MRKIYYTLLSGDEKYTVGELLKSKLSISSRVLSGLKKENLIFLNDIQCHTWQKGKNGDTLSFVLQDTFPSENVVPRKIPLDIIYEDDDILAVNKPSDMPVHPSMNNYENTLGNAVMYYFRNIPFVYRPVNRLDRDTTGAVIIAKTQQACFNLSKQMQNGIFKKTYLAVIDGVPEKEHGIIDAPIARVPGSAIKRCVSPLGKPAVTEYDILQSNGEISLVQVKLHTGRTHQIRVHFSYIGHPLLYDYLYGREVPGKILLLHCEKLEFAHPVTNNPLTIIAKRTFPCFS